MFGVGPNRVGRFWKRSLLLGTNDCKQVIAKIYHFGFIYFLS